ncbi:MAG: hypothetical protein EB084_16075 [Proteobacteria bacterium]|nr:hypothetical protein [Pseudomonadota bacterium]
MHRARRRAYILVVTLVSSVLTLFLMLHAGLQTEHFQLSRAAVHGMRNGAAISALQQSAIDRLMYDPDWHEGYPYSYIDAERVNATLTFDAGKAVHATNNHAGESAVPSYDGRPVPAGFVNLAARSLSPDDSPTNPYDDSLSLKSTRQMMVNVYRQYFLEDFNQDGQPGTSREAWTCEPKREFSVIDQFGFLGVSAEDPEVVLVQAGKTWWKDYDLEAVVAYYGYGGFGLVVRSDDTQAYAVSITPQHAFDRLTGAVVQPCLMRARGYNWTLLPGASAMSTPLTVDQGNELTNPFITVEPREVVTSADGSRTVRRDLPFGFWRIKVSVEDHDLFDREHRVLFITVTRLEPRRGEGGKITTFVDGPSWRSPDIALPPQGGPERGRIGFFCQRKTAIGFTNVVVNKRGRAMVRIPSAWSEQ